MPGPVSTRQRDLNRSTPPMARAKGGDVLFDLIAQHNKLLVDVAAIRTAAATSLAAVAATVPTAAAVVTLDNR